MEAGIGGKYTFSDGTHTHICIHFIFIANKCSGLHFPSNVEIFLVGADIFVYFDEGRFSRSRSSKVDKFVARKRLCDFLLVHNSNFGHILHRFGPTRHFMCS